MENLSQVDSPKYTMELTWNEKQKPKTQGKQFIMGFEHIFSKCMTTEFIFFWTLDLSSKIQIKGMAVRDVLSVFLGSVQILGESDYIREVHLLH